MSVMTKCASGFALFALAMGLMIACGGSAVSGGEPSGGASGSTAIDGGAGGAVGSAGTTNTTGGAGPGACSLPKQQGNCDAYDPSFWHNPETGLCEPFVYGGCGGNANRFASRDDCIAACPGGGSNWGACKFDYDCTQASLGCCEACEPVDANELLAFSSAHSDDATKAKELMCASVGACAPCQLTGEYEGTAKYFQPVCVSGQCSLLDIRKSPLTACNNTADCTLRDGAQCCEGYDGMGFVAVNKDADFCGGESIRCPPPGPEPDPIPAGLSATCQQGQCALALPTR